MLNLLFKPEETTELRFIDNTGKVIDNFVRNADKTSNSYIKQYNSKHNCYFGVLPRTRPGETSKVSRINSCFLDIDKKDFLNLEEKKRWKEIEKALNKEENSELRKERILLEKKAEEKFLPWIKRIEEKGFPAVNLFPTVKINSGYGFHYYFILNPEENSFEISCNGKGQECKDWREIQEALIELFRGDSVVKDLPRIMRLPNSYNVKAGDRRPCKIVELHKDRLYKRNDFLPLLKMYKKHMDKKAEEEKTCREYQTELQQRNPDEFKEAVLQTLREYGDGLFSDNKEYIRFIYACKSENIPYEAIDGILQKSGNYDYDRNFKDYESLEPSKITFGTAYYFAKEANETRLKELLSKKAIFSLTPAKEITMPAHARPEEKEEKKFEPLIPKKLKDLMEMKFPPIHWFIQDILPEGLTVFVGPPKIGKSWFALNSFLSIANGDKCLSHKETKKAAVAYFSLEDKDRRLQDRINMILSTNPDIKLPDNADYFTEVKRLEEGGLEQIHDYIDKNPEVKLIIIDTLQKVRKPNRGGNAYEVDTELLSKLHDIYRHKGVSILAIHHTKKGKSIDWIEDISGSQGIAGVADTIISLKKNRFEQEGILYVTGRDIKEDQELTISFNSITYNWELIGHGEIKGMSAIQREIIDILKDSEKPLTNKEITNLTGKNYATIRKNTAAMEERGYITNTGSSNNNKYILSSSFISDFSCSNGSNEDNDSNGSNGSNEDLPGHCYCEKSIATSIATNEKPYTEPVSSPLLPLLPLSSENEIKSSNENNSTTLNEVQQNLTRENLKADSPEKIKCQDCTSFLEKLHKTGKVFCGVEGKNFNPNFYPEDLHTCEFFKRGDRP